MELRNSFISNTRHALLAWLTVAALGAAGTLPITGNAGTAAAPPTHAEAEAAGRELERDLNAWWRRQLAAEFAVESVLELEFETHYRRFLMPTIRGSDKGSKKRYAGLVGTGDAERMVFKGLENVRTDWTRLAREFQEELYRRVFHREPFEDYVKSLAARVLGNTPRTGRSPPPRASSATNS